MRTISRISAAFLVLDGRDKSPLRQAAVLVDGQRRAVLSKGDGCFVVLNLPEGEHRFEVTAPGYQTVCRTADFTGAGTAEAVVLRHDPESIRRKKLDHFRFRFLGQEEALLTHRTVRVTLSTPCGSLRVVDGAKAGQSQLALSGRYVPAMLYQDCDAGKAGTVTLTGFDRESGCYMLRKPLERALPAGGALRPFWTLETGRDAVAVLPRIGLFMPWEELEFSFAAEGEKERKLTLSPVPGTHEVTVQF